MTRGLPRSIIPIVYRDLKLWPAPDENSLTKAERATYLAKRMAVEMYASGESYERIRIETQRSKNEVQRLVKRCVTPDGQGNIFGFTAMLNGVRLHGYNRNAPVIHAEGGGKGGCAGALGQLLKRLPEVAEFIEDYLFKNNSAETVHEARISYRDLHKKFIKLLRKFIEKNELTIYDWPFNTANRGYNALREYCINLRHSRLGEGMSARSGEDASRRHEIGQGHSTLLPLLRPYAVVQLDFHKVDAASVIVLVNAYGDEIAVPLSRWHIGLLADEYAKLILGVFISLETTPSGDCVLETVESALRPEIFPDGDARCALVVDGKVLPNQLVPSLAFQAFSALKMDNAWSNSATEVVNNIVDTVGCAINFGPIRRWWRRALIERIIEELTQRGLQRMPSTFGTGPADTRRTKPNEQAAKFRILLSDLISIVYSCVRNYNERGTEGLQASAPINVIKCALQHPDSGFFEQKLPQPVQKDMLLMKHTALCIVRGNIKKHVRPYVKTDRCVYTNRRLSNSYHLIGSTLILYIDRRDIRIAYATVKETGEFLGAMIPEKRWRQTACPWRLRKYLNRIALSNATKDESEDPVSSWGENGKQRLFNARYGKSNRKRNASSHEALFLAKLAKENSPSDISVELQTMDPETPSSEFHYRAPSDPFGLGNLPNLKSLDEDE